MCFSFFAFLQLVENVKCAVNVVVLDHDRLGCESGMGIPNVVKEFDGERLFQRSPPVTSTTNHQNFPSNSSTRQWQCVSNRENKFI
jgi:hypothetical protein